MAVGDSIEKLYVLLLTSHTMFGKAYALIALGWLSGMREFGVREVIELERTPTVLFLRRYSWRGAWSLAPDRSLA